jgi:hypothetical protein
MFNLKKIFLIAMLILTISGWSRSYRDSLPVDAPPNFQVTFQSGNFVRQGFLNNINSKAVMHFIKTFETTEKVLWIITEDGSAATFFFNNVKITSYYNRRGGHLYTKKIYRQSELDPLIISLIEDEVGKGFSIYMVSEKIMTNWTLYEITLENSKYWCKVILYRKSDGDLEKHSDNTLLLKQVR